MSGPIRVLHVVGARANFMKTAPVMQFMVTDALADLEADIRRRYLGAALPDPPLWDGQASERIADCPMEA